jgi:hypothetical protein
MEERTTGIPDDSPDNTVLKMQMILEEEAEDLGAAFEIEKDKEGDIDHKMVMSLKLGQKIFRMTISWARDECLAQGFSGSGYIETEWELKLRSPSVSFPPVPPFRWHLKPRKNDAPPFVPERILDGPLLRSLIRQKLGVPPRTSP